MGLMLRKPEGTPGKSWPAILIGMFVAFGGVLFGCVGLPFLFCLFIVMLISGLERYDTGTIGGILAMPYWESEFSTGFRDSTGHLNVTASQSATIVSILSAGTFFGALAAAPLGDFLGRRLGLIASTFVFIFGVILQTAATALPLFLCGRFFAGFGVGLISALSKLKTRFNTRYSADLKYSSSVSIRDCS